MGFWYGFGYCFLTDWEWDIKKQLGEGDLPNSFIEYLINNLFGLSLASRTVDILTGGLFIVAIFATLWVNVRQKKCRLGRHLLVGFDSTIYLG